MDNIYSFFGLSGSGTNDAGAAASAAAGQRHDNGVSTVQSDVQPSERAQQGAEGEGEWQEVTSASTRKKKKKKGNRRQKKKQKETEHDDNKDSGTKGQESDNDDEDDIESLMVFGGSTNTVRKMVQEEEPRAPPNTMQRQQLPTRSIGAEGTKKDQRTERRRLKEEKRYNKRREKAVEARNLTINGLLAVQDSACSKTYDTRKVPSDTFKQQPKHETEEESEKKATEREDIDPEKQFMELLSQGRAQARAGKPTQAISYLGQALKVANKSGNPYFRMLASRDGGFVWAKAGRIRAAISAWEQELVAILQVASNALYDRQGDSKDNETTTWEACKKRMKHVYSRLAKCHDYLAECERRDTYHTLTQKYDDPQEGDKALFQLLKRVEGQNSGNDHNEQQRDERKGRQPVTQHTTSARAPANTVGPSVEGSTQDDQNCQAKADEGIQAAMQGDWKICNSLLNRSIFYKDSTARLTLLTAHGTTKATFLMVAAGKGRGDMIRRLLQVDNSYQFINQQDANGLTALIWACKFGTSETVNWLLDSGADVNQCFTESGKIHLSQEMRDALYEWNAHGGMETSVELPKEVETKFGEVSVSSRQNMRESAAKAEAKQKTSTAQSNERKLTKWEPDNENLQTMEEYLTLEEEEQLKKSLNRPAAANATTSSTPSFGLWDGDAEHGALDDTFLAASNATEAGEHVDEKGNWDQFAANEALFGVEVKDFDETNYTTPLDVDKFSSDQIAQAEKYAAEIQASSTTPEEPVEENDEEKYAAVPR